MWMRVAMFAAVPALAGYVVFGAWGAAVTGGVAAMLKVWCEYADALNHVPADE